MRVSGSLTPEPQEVRDGISDSGNADVHAWDDEARDRYLV